MSQTEEVTISKLVNGGQGLGVLSDGRKVFVWGALPGETVTIRLIKQKHSFAEGIVEQVQTPSADRITPAEANYLATSPWQIMTLAAENRAKVAITRELFDQAHLNIDTSRLSIAAAGNEFHYRNKMEYSFWGDDNGLHLALHQRGSHTKEIVTGSVLARPEVDLAATELLTKLRELDVRAGDLKSVVIRCSQTGEAAASLFIKPTRFPRIELPAHLNGLRVYHSNPKSPASVPTRLLYEEGNCRLSDVILGRQFNYDVDSFFQVNVPVYERALEDIRSYCKGDPVDMYAGVGTIGLSVARQATVLIELDPITATMARLNIEKSGVKGEVIEASTEKSLEYISGEQAVIFDPPRAGLHAAVTKRCLDVLPPQIIYLSCNPATQARDLGLLQTNYDIEHAAVFNFFPRTPHIETLAVLARRTTIEA